MDLLDCYKEVYDGTDYESHSFHAMDSVYLFTNEILKNYIPDLTNKTVLTVASSGDHYFNILLNGASDIDLFDINYLAIFVLKLKQTAIQVLELDEFISFFDLDSKNFLNYETYKKLTFNLDEESIKFWNCIYSLADYKRTNIISSSLFLPSFNISELKEYNNYLEEKNYYQLKQILPFKNPNFIHADINDLSDILTKKYDTMFFSNIQLYQDNTTYLKTLKRMSKFLKENGEIYFAYIYNYPNGRNVTFYDSLLKSSHYSSKMVSPRQNTKRDKVYIYKK